MSDRGWVDFDVCRSLLCKFLLGLVGNWQNWLNKRARCWTIINTSQPTKVQDLLGHPVQCSHALHSLQNEIKFGYNNIFLYLIYNDPCQIKMQEVRYF